MVLMVIISAIPPGISVTAREAYPMNWGLDIIFKTDDMVSIGLIMPGQIG